MISVRIHKKKERKKENQAIQREKLNREICYIKLILIYCQTEPYSDN